MSLVADLTLIPNSAPVHTFIPNQRLPAMSDITAESNFIEHNSVLENALTVHQSQASTLTETEMSTILDRVATNFVALSKQAKDFAVAMKDIHDLKVQVNRLEADNQQLNDKLIACNNRIVLLEKEVTDALELASSYEKERDELRVKVDLQMIEVNDLQNQLAQAHTKIEATTKEADDLYRKAADANLMVIKLTDERDEAVTKAGELTEFSNRQAERLRAQTDALGELQTNLSLAHQDVDRAQKAKVQADTEVERLQARLDESEANRKVLRKMLSDIGEILVPIAAAA